MEAQEQQLTYLSQFDALTGEMNRWRLTENLAAALADATKFRGTCGFLLAAIDNLTRINEAYGYDVADEVIAAVGKRLRAKMRGADVLGRFSGNKFGIVLNKCTVEDMRIAYFAGAQHLQFRRLQQDVWIDHDAGHPDHRIP